MAPFRNGRAAAVVRIRPLRSTTFTRHESRYDAAKLRGVPGVPQRARRTSAREPNGEPLPGRIPPPASLLLPAGPWVGPARSYGFGRALEPVASVDVEVNEARQASSSPPALGAGAVADAVFARFLPAGMAGSTAPLPPYRRVNAASVAFLCLRLYPIFFPCISLRCWSRSSSQP